MKRCRILIALFLLCKTYCGPDLDKDPFASLSFEEVHKKYGITIPPDSIKTLLLRSDVKEDEVEDWFRFIEEHLSKQLDRLDAITRDLQLQFIIKRGEEPFKRYLGELTVCIDGVTRFVQSLIFHAPSDDSKEKRFFTIGGDEIQIPMFQMLNTDIEKEQIDKLFGRYTKCNIVFIEDARIRSEFSDIPQSFMDGLVPLTRSEVEEAIRDNIDLHSVQYLTIPEQNHFIKLGFVNEPIEKLANQEFKPEELDLESTRKKKEYSRILSGIFISKTHRDMLIELMKKQESLQSNTVRRRISVSQEFQENWLKDITNSNSYINKLRQERVHI